MANGSTLIGFMLTNGATLTNGLLDDQHAGGVWCQSINTVISNCVIAGNSAVYYGGGTYRGTLYNCALISNSVLTWSAGKGGGGTYNSTLYNCTLIGNKGYSGGGANNGTMYNCALIGNKGENGGGTLNVDLYNCTISNNSASYGGGAYSKTLYNCLLTGNSASGNGGGAKIATLYNCTIIGNSGGGTAGSWHNNSIVYSNSVNYTVPEAFTNCCTWPDPGMGTGNITNDPGLIDSGSGYGTNHVAGNYRLSNTSPCLNTGTNFAWMSDPADARSKDLDGRARIDRFSGQVDMGCYEHLPSGTIYGFR